MIIQQRKHLWEEYLFLIIAFHLLFCVSASLEDEVIISNIKPCSLSPPDLNQQSARMWHRFLFVSVNNSGDTAHFLGHYCF